MNRPPSFTPGPDLEVLSDAGPQSILGWVTDISPGSDPFEASQEVSFLTSNDHPLLFAQQPAVAADGTLTFTPDGRAAGLAVVTLVAHDDGGTAFGGQSACAPRTFTITVRFPIQDPPLLFIEPPGRNDPDYRLSWRPEVPGFVLQFSDVLPPAWVDASTGPTNPVRLPVLSPGAQGAGVSQRFYRLIRAP